LDDNDESVMQNQRTF